MEPSNLTQQGINAYKAGNKEEAVKLLMQAVRENAQDENAWLYLGASIDDPTKKRQAFQKVLSINPNNEKAKNALARLDAGTSGASTGAKAGTAGAQTGSAGSTTASARMNAAGDKMKSVWEGKEGFAVPGNIQGAPATVTVPELISNAQVRIKQAYKIFVNRDTDQIIAAGETATMWDSVFIAGVGAVAAGAAELVGGLIHWPFSGNFIFGFISPFLGAIAAVLAVAAGFYAAVYASRWYLQNQNVTVSLPAHSMYYALVFLPISLYSSLLTFVSKGLGWIQCFIAPLIFLAYVVQLVLLIYGIIVLKDVFDRKYGAQDNRGLITSVISVCAGWGVTAIVRSVVGFILRS